MTIFKIVSIIIALSVLFYFISSSLFFTKNTEVATVNHSRLWMEYAMEIVREKKPTPPEAARFYSIVATTYYETFLETKSEKQSAANVAKIINYIYSDKQASTTLFLGKINLDIDNIIFDKGTNKIFEANLTRLKNDNQKVFTKKFYGPEYWEGINPMSPEASQWERWNIAGVGFSVKDPPIYLSPEYMANLKITNNASANRTTEQVALINFWGGVPGTETPAGIWQNRYYNETKKLNLSNEKYAYVQMILAQVLSDSFMECWKVKYTHYTKRPSMVDPTINLAMQNPNFPSYLSGHSTVSASAATVLGHFFNDKKVLFMNDALNAKSSRLWGGIHFSYDNENGFKLGTEIGNFYIANVIKNP